MLSVIVLLIEIIILIIIKSIGVLEIDNIAASLLIFIFSFSFLYDIQNSHKLCAYSEPLSLGLLLRLFLLFFDLFGTSIRTLPQSGADSASFYYNARELALHGSANRESAFAKTMSFVFRVIGVNRLYGQFLLMLLSIISLVFFILIVDGLEIKDFSKMRAVWLVCLLPNFALLSSIFLRESIITALITLSAYCIIQWMSDGNSLLAIAAIALSTCSCLFHSGCIGITIGCIVCIMLYDYQEHRIHVSVGGALLTVLIAFVAAFVYLSYGDSLLGKFGTVETLSDIANTRAVGGSSYARYVGNSNNPFSMAIFTIPRIVYFLFSPFPWQWRGGSDIIAFFFSGLFYLITIRNAIIFLRNGDRTNRGLVICLLIIAFFCTFIFAWGVSNTGTASRHRDKMVCLYGIIYALTTSINKKETETVIQKNNIYLK